MVAAVNFLFYAILRGILRIAAGEAAALPVKSMFLALTAMFLLMAYYLPRMTSLPGKLIRGEE